MGATVVVAVFLAACASSGDGPGAATTAATAPAQTVTGAPVTTGAATTAPRGGLLGTGLFASNPNRGVVQVQSNDTIPTEMFLKQGYCPPVQIRPGTESFVVYERGKEDMAEAIRFQASIVQTARECATAGPETLQVKVGVRGRIAAGPKGGAGNVTVPLRIAVIKQQGNAVLYSQKFDVPATFAAGQFSVDFQQVFDQVLVQLQPADRDLIVFVGFDGGPAKPTS